MSKLFDRIEQAVFTGVNRVFGETDPASWTASDGSGTFTATVLFSNPTGKESLDQMAFSEADPYIEFLSPAFPGLKFLVDSHGSADSTEFITISGVLYAVTEVQRLRDGNNYKAYLLPVDDGYGPKNQ